MADEPIREIPAFFSYARADDDDYEIVAEFYELFKEELTSKGYFGLAPFLDKVELPQFGPLDEGLKARINKTRILLIFLGRCYAQSEYCLKEFEWFRERHKADFRRRILIIELHSDARAMVRNADQLELLESNHRIEWYKKTMIKDMPLTPTIPHKDGHAVNNPAFRIEVGRVVDIFLESYGVNDPPPRAPEPYDPDVVIGLATRDIKEAVDQLRERLEKSFRVHAISLEEYAEGHEVYGPQLQAPKLVVLPFSWHAVLFSSDGPEGGHLAAQRTRVAETSKVLWWRPPCGVVPDGPVAPGLRRENNKHHLDYLGARLHEASQASPEALVDEIRRQLSPAPSSSWPPQIALEIRSPYEGETKRLQDYLKEIWRQKYGEPVLEIQAAELQPTEDLTALAEVVDGILLAAVGKPNATVAAQMMFLKKALLRVMDEQPKWGLFAFRPPTAVKGRLEPPPPCYVLFAAEATQGGLELKAEETEIAELAHFLEQVRVVAELRRQNGAAARQI